MAWIFSLSAECGPDKASAENFASHFSRVSWTLSSGLRSECRADLFQDVEENWWCRVCPTGMSEIGIETPDAAYLMTELGLLLYQRLRTASDFRYALVGVEVDEFRTYEELVNEISKTFPGLVLMENVVQVYGQDYQFQAFSAGYLWQPYEGEVYKPLVSSSELKNKLNELLAL